MQYISFNGVTSSSLGLIVVDMPNHARAKMRYTEYTIPGRNGALHVNEGYDPIDITVIMAFFQQQGIASARSAVNNWLTGSGKLYSSDDMLHCWDASVLDGVTYDRQEYYGKYYDTITVKFRCQPVMHLTTPAFYTITEATTFAGQGNTDSFPKIIVTGVDDCTVTLNGQTIYLENVASSHTVTIDCEAGYVYSEQAGVAMSGEFPKLNCSGNNTVSIGGGVTSIKLYPNWGWV